jgi:hypothetical protein
MVYLSFQRPTLLIFLLALVIWTQADYVIDDSNTTVLHYTVDPAAHVKWGPFGGFTGEQLNLSLPNGSSINVDNHLGYNDTLWVVGTAFSVVISLITL